MTKRRATGGPREAVAAHGFRDGLLHLGPLAPTLSVFDMAQIDPIEGVDPLPSDSTQRLVGDDNHGVLAPLTTHLASPEWRLAATVTHTIGYTDPETLRVILAEGASVEQSAKALIRETAHIDLCHIDSVEEYQLHRGRMEVDAESVAYVVAGLFGFDTSAYSIGYIAGWSDEDVTVIRESSSRVLALRSGAKLGRSERRRMLREIVGRDEKRRGEGTRSNEGSQEEGDHERTRPGTRGREGGQAKGNRANARRHSLR